MSATLYYDVLKRLKDQLLLDDNVNTVTTGDITDIDLQKKTIFPLSHIMINNTPDEGNVIRVNITIFYMDIVDISKDKVIDLFKGNDNLEDVLNTQHAVMTRMNALMRRGSLNTPDFSLDGNPFPERFVDRFENLLAGWACTFEVLVRNDMTIC